MPSDSAFGNSTTSATVFGTTSTCGFGNTSAPASTSGFSFGGFGTTTTTEPTGFSFDAPTATSSPFSFPSLRTATTTSSFGFGGFGSSLATTAAPGFSFDQPTNTFTGGGGIFPTGMGMQQPAANMADNIAELNRNHTTIVSKIAELKWKTLGIQLGVLKVLVHQEMTRKMGYAIQVDEEQFRIKFEAIQAQFKEHLKLTSQIRMQNYLTSVFEGERKDEISKEEIREVFEPNSSVPPSDNVLNEDSEIYIRIVSVPSKLSQVVLLQHPASFTLHGYVKVSVLVGNISIFGYNVKEGEITVFSTEGTGLKKVVTLKPKFKKKEVTLKAKYKKKEVTLKSKYRKKEIKSDIKGVKKKLTKLTQYENIDINEIIKDIKPSSVVLVVEKMLLPAPLRFLEQYYPAALQTRWPEKRKCEKKRIKEKRSVVELCSTQQSYAIDISGDFKKLSKQINEVISKTVPDDEFGPRILVRGEKNVGKSTLIRYLMNSSLNVVKEVYFLDTDPDQTEYTPPGVISLYRVTKPLLDPPFAHQKKALKMILTGSVTPATSPKLHEASVKGLMKGFNNRFKAKTLFVNTMGWVQGVGELCLQNIKKAVKPSIEIELRASDPNLSLTREVDENKVTVFIVPSKALPIKSKAPSFSAEEWRNFNLVGYLGQCQKTYLPVTLINSFHPFCVSWDKIALYVMGKKVPHNRLVEAIHCSIVALCHADLSIILKSDNPDFPMTLIDEPICECLGFGLVRASDMTNHLFYVVTPLTLDQLKNVNALVKGNIMIPDELILKQTILNVPLPFTNQSQEAETPALLDRVPFTDHSQEAETPSLLDLVKSRFERCF